MKNKDDRTTRETGSNRTGVFESIPGMLSGVKKFHVTSDNLVFLDKDYQNAVSTSQGRKRRIKNLLKLKHEFTK